jgi:hypothetical protein
VLKAHRGIRDSKVLPARKERLVAKDFRAIRDSKAVRVCRAHRALQGPLEAKERKVVKALKESKVFREFKALLVVKGFRVSKE